jgi:hypothetical protein
MPAVFAIDGAEFGAVVNPQVLQLQTALVSLGNVVGDSTLKALVTDGLIGPETATATNRALITHLAVGEAAALYRTGKLTQAQIVAYADILAMIVENAVKKRGGTLVAARAPAKKAAVTPAEYRPAEPAVPRTAMLAPLVDTQGKIVKWAVIGLGVVVVAGVVYYFVARRPRAFAYREEEEPAARRERYHRLQPRTA